ncbi:hypothetical protein COCMIDRAFT_105661 [Bipolaris oryzae ATCC 44560]|uniref:Uncharacterized protein n=1 Tax=Bipolaris oryzae ATCC 44560 TaxID=930090 RepID=W6Z1T1_COCMI|nr:uncharacterized protein COCMIDRAFT_105661 [Bipolaris oryzae ATCC 44560]EUC41614.1 hypothetical protein COCMIDRAFT_105661 [Bipolaris oryzae ATCC 44560]
MAPSPCDPDRLSSRHVSLFPAPCSTRRSRAKGARARLSVGKLFSSWYMTGPSVSCLKDSHSTPIKGQFHRDPREGVETWYRCVWILARHVKAGGWGLGSIFASM